MGASDDRILHPNGHVERLEDRLSMLEHDKRILAGIITARDGQISEMMAQVEQLKGKVDTIDQEKEKLTERLERCTTKKIRKLEGANRKLTQQVKEEQDIAAIVRIPSTLENELSV